MKISKSTSYGLLAVGYIANNKEEKLVASHDIAKDYKIPLDYLLKILQQLVKANILQSKRGPQGGYSLARPATKISMLEIIEAIDGSIVGHLGLAKYAPKEKFSAKTEKAYAKVVTQSRNAFKQIKISQLF